MPSQIRIRGLAEELKQEGPGLKEKHQSLNRGRRNGNSSGGKECVAFSGEADVSFPTQESHSWIDWATMEASTLNTYRQLRRLQAPPPFGSAFNQRILCRQGVGKRSPTMARHAERRKISAEQLALVVKKDFHDQMLNELESITDFIYSVRNEDKCFRMHFNP